MKHSPEIPKEYRLTRRQFMGLGACMIGFAGLTARPAEAASLAGRGKRCGSPPPPDPSLDRAYTFLDEMMDLYFQGSTLRLVQSYVSTKALRQGDLGYTYDNALVVLALLQRGNGDDLARATVLGDSLVYGQANDPFADGRIRNVYHTDPFVKSDGSVNVATDGTDIGNMSWTGLALIRLYVATNDVRYLNAASNIGAWIQKETYDTRGAGGYTGGLMSNQSHIKWKSTEHNIDAYALFTLLAALTGDSTWTQLAQHALPFIASVWNAQGGFFWTGTGNDGVTINQVPIPEDVQSWSYLALADPTYAASIDWAVQNLAAHNKIFSGVSFSNADRSGVWFEGTAHLAAALIARNGTGDASQAQSYLSAIQLAQAQGPHTDGKGIIAASKNHLRTGDGGSYFAALHIGATAWYCLAAQNGNPFRF